MAEVSAPEASASRIPAGLACCAVIQQHAQRESHGRGAQEVPAVAERIVEPATRSEYTPGDARHVISVAPNGVGAVTPGETR